MIHWMTTTTYQPRLLLIDTLKHDTLLRATIFPFFKKNSFLFSSFLFPPSLGEFWITLIADANAFRSVPSDDVDPDFYRIDLACQGVYLAKLNMSMFPPFPNPSVVGARTPSTSTCSLISFVTQTGETALLLEISSPKTPTAMRRNDKQWAWDVKPFSLQPAGKCQLPIIPLG